MSLNKAMIIGNLGKDPEVRYTQAGGAVTNISLATSEKYKDKQTGQTKEVTEWHRIVFFGKLAEIAGEYLKKGATCFVEGQIRTRKYTDGNGIERYTTEIVGSSMRMIGGKGDHQGQSGGHNDAPAGDDGFDSDVPF